ncbi:MAG: hypothetical protein COV99_01680 [Bacteroidetes bacterium CG12_big_fil_rev_8_21_14_0_65_60_17]|nr:MAG: hypothetical protein COV99_01680 [Bacteroidetes bacterium CG12_big_fil_rev_8_21_14_0_65_60_17]
MPPFKRALTIVLLFLVSAVLVPRTGLGQEATWSLSFQNEPLSSALATVVAVTGADLAWDPLLVTGKRSFCRAEELPFDELLSCVLQGTGLDFVRRSNGLYVLEIATEGPPLFGNLRGIVLDVETEQPISNAHVYLAEAQRGSVANQEGMFIFPRLLPGTYNVRVSHLGYRQNTISVSIRAGSDASSEVLLHPESVLIAPIVIDGLGMTPASSLLGAAVASQEDALSTANSGASGLLQSLAAMPGVRVSDATADIHIQGGDAGEHEFRLDGAPVFLPLNVATFVGPFSPFALGRITVHKAGFGVDHGSQISGVVEAEHDLRTPVGVRGVRRQNQLTVQIDPLSTNVRFSGNRTDSRGRHITTLSAGRIGMWRLASPPSLAGLLDDWNTVDTFLLSAFASTNTPFANLPPEGEPALHFADVHQAVRVRFGALRTLNASAYWGRSGIGNELSAANLDPANRLARFRDLYSWQNGMAQARYDVVRSAHVLTHVQVRGSFYRLNHDFEAPDSFSAEQTEDDGNDVFEVGLRAGMDYYMDNGHHLEAALEIIGSGSDFNVAGTQQLPVSHSSSGFRVASFLKDDMQLGRHGSLEIGTRLTWLNARQTLYGEPRISTRFDFSDTAVGAVSFFVGGGLYRQFTSQFDISSRSPRAFVSSTRVWLQNDATVTPPKTGHVALEVLVSPTPRWSLSLESYYKRNYHVLTLDYSADPEIGKDLPQSDFLQASQGYSAGLSASVTRTVGMGGVGLSIDYSRAERTIANLFGERSLTVPWNEPLRLEAKADLVPFKGAVLLVRWKSIWDRTWGFRKSYYDFLGAHLNNVDNLVADMRSNGVSEDAIRRIQRQIEFFGLTDPDAHVLPGIHQLDTGFSWTFPVGSYAMQLRADVINVLGRKNTAEWLFQLDEEQFFLGDDSGQTGLLERNERPLLPRVVSIAARLTW